MILLSIAIAPLVNPHFWEKNLWWISLFVFTVPMMSAIIVYLGPELKSMAFEKVEEYISFILLLTSLFVISGGIHISGTLNGNPTQNTIFLFTGGVIASIIGTTGASMLLIRPIIRANREREHKAHIIIFFIFIVSNIGGVLTPLGDPPLFLGYLQGVPFEWTMNLFPEWFFATGVLLIVFYFYDRKKYDYERKHNGLHEPYSYVDSIGSVKKEMDSLLDMLQVDQIQEKKKISLTLLRKVEESVAFASAELEKHLKKIASEAKEPIRFGGKLNFILLAGVVASIYFQGSLLKRLPGIWPAFGPQEASMILLTLISLKITPMHSNIRIENGFSFGPIKEVAFLFSAIFATMIPALYILEHQGAHMGITKGWQFFWSSGILSSFLDNAPTYLTFLSVGKSLAVTNDLGFTLTDGGNVNYTILKAISCGSVFMGANSYIGNGPNFMVKAIAESHNIKMPSFFGYMAYSGIILLSLFFVMTFIFFI